MAGLENDIPIVEEANDENGDEAVDEQPQNQQHNAIESLDHYLERYGLVDLNYGAQSERNIEEERTRMQQEADYQADIHKSIFGTHQDENDDERAQFLASIHNESIDFETSRQVIRNVPLKPMAESCETIYTLASFRQRQNDASKDENKRLTFSLKSFQHEAVVEFINIIQGDKLPEQVDSDDVVECCQIARYMQCETILESMVNILIDSVDESNCFSLAQLADQLELPRLFEKSMAQMMTSVTNLQSHELWNDFSPELQQRITSLESVLQSSVHCRLHTVYFGDMQEYLSIFAENVQYYRERLDEAKERQGEEPAMSSDAWQDAQRKILKQEERLETLVAVLNQQKEIFGGGGNRNYRRHERL